MKKHMSVFSLAVAASFWRILMLLVALAATQLLVAWIMVKSRIGSLALEEMVRQVPEAVYQGDIMKKGQIKGDSLFIFANLNIKYPNIATNIKIHIVNIISVAIGV